MHHKLSALGALLNFFPTVCDDFEYIKSRGLPGPVLPGPNGLVYLARFIANHVDHWFNQFQKRDDVTNDKIDPEKKLLPNKFQYMPSTPAWFSIPQFKELVRWPGCGCSGVLTEMPTEFDLDAHF